MERIGDRDFAHVIRLTPLVSIDLVLCDPDGAILLGLRENEPAKGFYFVPGGVIRKTERLADAFARILAAETGLDLPFAEARFIGVFEHIYARNRYLDPGYGTHYVALGYRVALPRRPEIRLDDQHSRARWMSEVELLAAPDVHEYTKGYFLPRRDR